MSLPTNERALKTVTSRPIAERQSETATLKAVEGSQSHTRQVSDTLAEAKAGIWLLAGVRTRA